MRKKLLSIFVVLALVINLMPITYVRAAVDSKITISADKTDVKPGDTINYTVSAQSDVKFIGMQLELNIPTGLTFVSKSGKFNSSLKNAIIPDPDDEAYADNQAYFRESNKQIGIVSAQGYTFNGNTTILTFQCTVDDNANGNLEVGFSKDKWGSAPSGEQIDHVVQTATVKISKVPTGISLNKTATTIEKDKSEKLTATVEPSDATDKTVTWVSSDTSVATVENDGTVTAKNKGKATITAKTSNNHTADCEVTVISPVKSLYIRKGDSVCHALSLNKDEQATLNAEVSPSDADNKNVTWTSSDESIATVSNGVVKGIKKGTATITATSVENSTVKATCTVTVGVPLKSISLNETSKTLKNGESFTFEVTYNPEDTDAEKAVTWISTNTSVAMVDNNGKATVVSCTGTATIMAIATADNTITASAIVTAAHKDEQLTLHEAKEATCIAEGNKAYYTCSGCQDYYDDSTGRAKITDKESVKLPIDSTAHDWDEGRTTKEPTCTEKGEKTFTCKNESKHTKTEEISAKGHTMTKHDAKEATCETDGNIDYYTCSVCNKIYKDETGRTEITQEQTVVKAKGHDWGEWQETIPATYETEGQETRTCKNNSSHTQTRAIPKLHKHELTKTEAKAATCVEEGNIEYYTCSICNKTFSDSQGTNEVENVVIAVDTNAHDWDEWTITKDATCTEKGSKTRTCKLDSKHTETEEIEMLAHTLTKVDEVKATCEKEGNKTYYKCSVCDKYFEDETGTTEITDKTSVITSALGHDYDEGIITTPKTCTIDGVKTYTCKHDSTHTITETIPAGHEWGEWVVTKEATVDEEGSKTRTCKLDGSHIETEVIARISYAIEKGNGQTHIYEENKDLEIKANGTLDKLVRLLVDGKELSEDNYKLESGSTIAILKTAYLDTLAEGQHTLTFEYTDGSIDAIFNVAKEVEEIPTSDTAENTTENTTTTEQDKTETTTTKSSSPKTGDSIMIWVSLLIVSALGVIATAKFIKKKDK